MLHAVIMAGGAGTRFWPLSRISLPKQLLHFGRQHSLLQDAVNRLAPIVATENILVITNQQLVDTVRQQVPQLDSSAIIGEPAKRDTAPCIALAAALIEAKDPGAMMAVMPSDHIIQPSESFQQALATAVNCVEQQPARLMTFGIAPDRPAETYGYIQVGPEFGEGIFDVLQFKEKPDSELAQHYLQQGGYYWNSGIFVWQAQTILNALNEACPDMMKRINRIAESWGEENCHDVFHHEFSAIDGTSIDYAVMENYAPVCMVKAPFEWDDVGSWQALGRLFPADENNNTIIGKHVGVDTNGAIIQTSEQHLVATVGVRDLIIVHTDDATLVANKHDEESVRKLVQLLETKDASAYL